MHASAGGAAGAAGTSGVGAAGTSGVGAAGTSGVGQGGTTSLPVQSATVDIYYDVCGATYPKGKQVFDNTVSACACTKGGAAYEFCGGEGLDECAGGSLDPSGVCFATIFPFKTSDPCGLRTRCETDFECEKYMICLGEGEEQVSGFGSSYCDDRYPDSVAASFDLTLNDCSCDEMGPCDAACLDACNNGIFAPGDGCYECMFPANGADPCGFAKGCDKDEACLAHHACVANEAVLFTK